MSEIPAAITLVPLPGIPAVGPEDDLAALIGAAAERAGVALEDGVLVVCQKVISKAEGRLVALADVVPSEEAKRIAEEDGKTRGTYRSCWTRPFASSVGDTAS